MLRRVSNKKIKQQLDRIERRLTYINLFGWFALGLAMFFGSLALPIFNINMYLLTLFGAILGVVIMAITFLKIMLTIVKFYTDK